MTEPGQVKRGDTDPTRRRPSLPPPSPQSSPRHFAPLIDNPSVGMSWA